MQTAEYELTCSEAQNEIFFGDLKKYNVITKGRRMGLTRGAAHAFIEYMLVDRMPYLLWGDTIHSNIQRYFDRYFVPAFKQLNFSDYKFNSQDKTLKVFDSTSDFRSADKPENWEGFGYNIIFLNEAGIILKNKYLLNNAVLPMMVDSPDSVLIAAGVPKGKKTKGEPHPFYEMFRRAQSDTENYRVLRYTSYDNPFIEASEIDLLESQLATEIADQEIRGLFVDVEEKTFLYAFDETKHVKEGLELNPNLPLIVSFDFNKDPMTCVVAQRLDIWTLHIFDSIKMMNGSTPEVCEELLAKYPQWQGRVTVTGDATGRNRTPLERGNKNHWQVIKHALKIKDFQAKVRRANISHSNSRMLCNSVLQNANFAIDKTNQDVIFDCSYTAVDDQGKIIKTQSEGRHFMDCVRYLIDAEFPDFITHPQRYER